MSFPQRSHITRCRGVYHYRRRLPRPHGGEVQISLRTSHFREAQHLAAVLDQVFNETTETMSDRPNLQAILKDYLRQALEEDHQQWLQAPPRKPVYSGGGTDLEPVQEDLETLGSLLAEYRQALAERDTALVDREAGRLMEEHDLPESCRSELALGILEAQVKVLEEARNRATRPQVLGLSATTTTPDPHSPASEPETEETVAPSPLMSELKPEFFHTKERLGEWGKTTVQNAEMAFTALESFLGDRPVREYTREAIGEFHRQALELPKDHKKIRKQERLTLTECVPYRQENGLETIEPNTVARWFGPIVGFFDWLKQYGHYEGDNPATGFAQIKSSQKDSYQPWPSEALSTFFGSPEYQGRHYRFRKQAGNVVVWEAAYWIPLMGLFTGARLEELAQLQRENIVQAEGIYYLDIAARDESQSLKTEESWRKVPIHSRLIELGFLEYLEEVTAENGDPLFPALPRNKTRGNVGGKLGEWLNDYMKWLGIKEKQRSFHSFRGMVATQLGENRVIDTMINQLQGWKGNDVRTINYAKGHSLSSLKEAIETLRWPETDSLERPDFPKINKGGI